MNKYQAFRQNFDLRDFVYQHFDVTTSGSRIFIVCPFHTEEHGSCMIDQQRWWCFGACGTGGDSVDFLSRLYGKTRQEVVETTCVDDIPHIAHASTTDKYVAPLSISLVKTYHKALMRRRDKLQYLYDRHLDRESIQKACLGYGVPIDFTRFRRPRYSIPHFDQHNTLIGVRYRIDPLYDDEDKYIAHPGIKGVLYNVGLLEKHDNIIYCGSQLDAVALYYRWNIPAIAPPSENTFDVKWIPLFSNKNVLIWLDNDAAGRNGSLKVYRNIKDICDAKIFTWPSEFNPKDDLKDFIDRYGVDGVRQVIYA